MIVLPRGWRLFDFIDEHGTSVYAAWARLADKDALARVNQKLDMLRRHGSDLPTGLLAGTRLKHVDKIRVNGKSFAWRVMICKGTVDNNSEFTILYIAREKDRKLIPPDAYQRAEDNRQILLSDPSRRRPHERIS